jgi:orotate phosphoribosyltransferase
VVIVEDVTTTGGSSMKAVERAREEGLEVVGIVTLVDREEVPGRPSRAPASCGPFLPEPRWWENRVIAGI